MEISPGLRIYLAEHLMQGSNAYLIEAGGYRMLIDAPRWAVPRVLSDIGSLGHSSCKFL